ncbi:MAG: hypothetical protein ACT4QB_10215 [Gammaproteobacteria bacterium]
MLAHAAHSYTFTSGHGFEEVYSERIFELFQRLHGRDGYEGTGMGRDLPQSSRVTAAPSAGTVPPGTEPPSSSP